MCVICDGMSYAEMWAFIRTEILDRGWYLQAVEGEDERNPPFAYTVGLTERGHPELITFGMHDCCAHDALKPLAEAVLSGRRLDEGDDVTDLFREYAEVPQPQLLRFPDSSTHLFVANELYQAPDRPPVEALQFFWPSEIPLLAHAAVPDHPPMAG